MKTGHNETPYTFLVSTERKMGLFRNRWKSFIQGTKDAEEKEKQDDQKEENNEAIPTNDSQENNQK
jgi:predicted RNA polymerase sigma factor